ncbi:MAG TPA: acyl-CoA dehydrogenase family protein [Candidatus Binatia bacterium]|nr:acyl-CoA dehydrogenase family protein [Candidatus Binatia bacterium]
MEIRFTAAEESFRAEARAWLETNMPRTSRPEIADLAARRAYDMGWQRRMYDAGWAGINWPKEYGGRGASLMEQIIWYEEYARVGAPDVTTGFVGLKHAGPTLIACGTEAQKSYHLPRILRGDIVWCQGFSEPNAGSDLANLQCRAIIDGDDLVITGQKIWTSFGHIAEVQELLVRTDPDAPKHKGITWVICPMGVPGIDIRPIKTLAGNSDFCEVFYDNVRIPLANVVGKLNDGWRVAMATLSFERGTAFMSEQVRMAHRMDELIAVARRVPGPNGHERAIDDDEIARRLAMARAEVEAMRSMTYRSLSLAARTGMPGAEASMIRLFFSELIQRIDVLAMDILGADAITSFSADGASRNEWGERYLTGLSQTIGGGTKEIQRNIIGERVLGLPR